MYINFLEVTKSIFTTFLWHSDPTRWIERIIKMKKALNIFIEKIMRENNWQREIFYALALREKENKFKWKKLLYSPFKEDRINYIHIHKYWTYKMKFASWISQWNNVNVPAGAKKAEDTWLQMPNAHTSKISLIGITNIIHTDYTLLFFCKLRRFFDSIRKKY